MIRSLLLILLMNAFYGVNGANNKISVRINQGQTRILKAGINHVNVNNINEEVSSVTLQVTAFQKVCVSLSPECKAGYSYEGKSTGIEQVIKDRMVNQSWYIITNVSQKAFIFLHGYSLAPIVGACPPSQSPLRLNPNLQLKQSNVFYNDLSFSYATMLDSNRKRNLLSCEDKSFRNLLIYEIYILPWNQRYNVFDPTFNSSSVHNFSQALYKATSLNVFRYGSMIRSFVMDSVEVPHILITKRLGLDFILSVVIRISDQSNSKSDEELDLITFYVPQNVMGCDSNGSGCAIITSVWAKFLLGMVAVCGFFFSHFARRFHAINTFVSGFLIGSITTFALLTQLTTLDTDASASISIAGGGLVFGMLVMCVFWKAKPSLKISHIPLYVTASFLLSATIFFTPLGNQPFWNNMGVFCAVFFSILCAFALVVFPPFTEKFSVDFCASLVGSYIFLFGVMVVFVPGSIFPYLFFDAAVRVSVPDAHRALSVTWAGLADTVAFIVWPSLVLILFLFNRHCSPAFSPARRHHLDSDSNSTPNWTAIDAWPPLPPAAYVSERTPLVAAINSDPRHIPAPPPYHEPLPLDGPPSYRP